MDLISIYITFSRPYRSLKKIKRQFPNILLIAGGIHSYSKPEEIIEYGFNIVTRGDADLSFPETLRALTNSKNLITQSFSLNKDLEERLKQVKGLIFKTEDGRMINTGTPNLLKDLDSLPFVDF